MNSFIEKLLYHYENSKGIERLCWLAICLIITIFVLPIMVMVAPAILGFIIGIFSLVLS